MRFWLIKLHVCIYTCNSSRPRCIDLEERWVWSIFTRLPSAIAQTPAKIPLCCPPERQPLELKPHMIDNAIAMSVVVVVVVGPANALLPTSFQGRPFVAPGVSYKRKANKMIVLSSDLIRPGIHSKPRSGLEQVGELGKDRCAHTTSTNKFDDFSGYRGRVASG